MSDIGSPLAVAASGDGEDTIAAKITRAARMLCEAQTEGSTLVGYVSIGLFEDGGFSMGFQCPEGHPIIGPTMFTAYVREIIRRELTGMQSADDYAKQFLL